MSTTTNIQFENENRVYYSGEVIKGRATLTLNEEKIVRGESVAQNECLPFNACIPINQLIFVFIDFQSIN